MKRRKFCVYKITNIINNKIYIGKTAANTTRRWRDHIRLAENLKSDQNNQAIHIAMHKYGIDNFTFEIISYHTTEDIAYSQEKKTIKRFKSNNPKFGYNQNEGGRLYGSNGKKLTNSQVKKLIKEYANTDISLLYLSRNYNLSKPTTKSIINRETYVNVNISDNILYNVWLKLHRPKPYIKSFNEDTAKLSSLDVKGIFKDFASGKYSYNKLAKKYNTVVGNIDFILKRETWKNVKIHHNTLKKVNSILDKNKSNLPTYDREELKNNIFEDYFNNKLSKKDIADKYNLKLSFIIKILNGTYWKKYKLKDEFKNKILSKRVNMSKETALEILLYYCNNNVSINDVVQKFCIKRNIIIILLKRESFKFIDIGSNEIILKNKIKKEIIRRKIEKDQYPIIYNLWKDGKKFSEIGRMFNVNRKAISSIIYKLKG